MTDRHIGFRRDAPQEVIWSQSAWIRPVDPGEQSRIRTLFRGILLFTLITMGSSLILALVVMSLEKKIPEPLIIGLLSCLGVLLFAGLLILISHGWLLKWILLGHVRRRPGRLFDPDQDTLFVGIEDPFTYDKQKLAPDDVGLLQITPEAILLEMANYRAGFHPWDLEAAVLHTGKNRASLRLTCNQDPAVWSVTMVPIAAPRRLIRAMDPVKKARQFLSLLEEAGVTVVREAEPSDAVILPSRPPVPPPPPLPSAVAAGAAAASQSPPPIPPHLAPLPEEIRHTDLLDARLEAVTEAIRKKQKRKKSIWLKLLILLGSLALFYFLGKKYWGFEFILILLPAVMIHEAGHYIGMKIFGYKDMQVFFLPLMGAAVAGQGRHVATWKRAVVSLLGPMPGILLSVPICLLYLITGTKIYLNVGLIFLILNLLNLLPFFPLDGGRFLHEVLYSRNRYLEMVMNILAAVILLLLGFALKDWFLRGLGFLNLFIIQYKFKLASAAGRLSRDLMAGGQFAAGGIIDRSGAEEIPPPLLKRMIHWVYNNMPGPIKPSAAAAMILDLWERVRIRPPGIGATLALLAVFGFGYVISLFCFSVLALRAIPYKSEVQTRIVQEVDLNGVTRYKEQQYSEDRVYSETGLSDDQQYYHGVQINYREDGKIWESGNWDMGRRSGIWQYFDSNDTEFERIIYEQGRPLLIHRKEGEQWVLVKWEDFSEEDKEYFQKEAQFQRGPGKSPDFDFPNLLGTEDPNQ
jgi:Zn-dependent protease